MEMQHKLQEVLSPSSSKPDETDYDPEMDDELIEDGSQSNDDSQMSIPMAHREYEKIMRQLEAECRTHIKCE